MANRLKKGSSPKSKAPARIVKFEASEFIKAQFDFFRKKIPEVEAANGVFNKYKREIPPRPLPDKMNDHALDGKLKGIKECHLAGDVLLLYTHDDDVVHMLYICSHDDLYGKRAKQMRTKIRTLIGK